MQPRDENCCVVLCSYIDAVLGYSLLLWGWCCIRTAEVVCRGSAQFLGAKRLIFHSHQDKAVRDECQDPVRFISDTHHLPV